VTESRIAPIVGLVLKDLLARLMKWQTTVDASAPAHIDLREYDKRMPAEPTAA
jgi:hypothetical protein